ncbi:MAG TPA: sugar phosphate isomerase/epimerase [Candidatus Methylomirabilis sp.]|nr:sugar phosphate isomerase/epimerase [Candidatus Methylomirabilis sp.]HSC71474.1 sugar phosphate isomerase/epimerase [Candidatus Methylomirabilis sp.]
MDRIVSVSSMAFDGFPLETALDELAALGVRFVEPASVDKVFQHLVEADFCDSRAVWLRRELTARNLACLSLSAHMDLTQPDSVGRFYRRLEFAQAIGARTVNSIAGPVGGLEGFRANIPAIAKRATELGIIVALENHGDLVNCGAQIVEFVQAVGSPAVRANYDTGNAWYYAKGGIDPAAELAEVAPVVAHVHLKAPSVEEGMMRWVALGEGVLDLPAVGRVLRTRLPGVPVSIELSLRQRSRDFEPRWRTPEFPSLPEIRGIITRSLRALERILV